MAKFADNYYKLDPWSVVEDGFDRERSRVSESIFSLGNEHMGIRGYFEEGTTCDSLLGSYFNGVYEFSSDVNGSAYRGIVDHTHFMVNSVDWLYTRIYLDGEQLDLNHSSIEGFQRVLDFKSGTLSREFIWNTRAGKQLKLSFCRFLSMSTATQGCQRIVFEPLNFSGTVDLILALDFGTTHESRQMNCWRTVKKEQQGTQAAILGETLTSGQRVFSGMQLQTDGQLSTDGYETEHAIGLRASLMLEQGVPSRIDRLVSNLVDKEEAEQSNGLWEAGIEALEAQKENNFDQQLKRNVEYWTEFWNRFDIEIDGDERNQQGIRFCIFQMQQTYHGQNPQNNIGAKGLTGEAYNGHAFWDSETYCLPFYLFNNPTAAKNLLEFRYAHLEQAKERAKMLDCEGACFPIATLNGEEACDLWQHASLQFQPSTGVAYGIWHYVHVCGDKQFLYTHGVELLVQISRFLKSRGAWDQSGHSFGFYAVMGPDEFHMMVNNNCYTNYMAKRTFEYMLEVVQEMKQLSPDNYTDLLKRTGLLQSELQEFEACARCMHIPIDTASGIFEQHEGYFNLPHIEVDQIPVEEFPLYYNWSYDRIYRSDMIKQPDVLMFQFLYANSFNFESKRVNYEYYEPKCIHESSLSPSIHSILASELHKHEEAFDFFGFATRMDLDNYNRNTKEGLHTTSLAGAWVNIVYGFGGMRSDGDCLSFEPSIPCEWKSYSFRIKYHEAVLCIEVNKETVRIRSLNGGSAELKLYGKRYTIDSSGVEATIPAEWRG